MGRPSKLTDKQWSEIEAKLLEGESRRSLADKYGVSEAAIRKRFGSHIEKIKAVANQVVAAERAMQDLPVSSQVAAANYAAKLRALSDHLLGAATYGAATSHRLNGIAHAKVQEIDDAAPLTAESLEALKGVAALTKIANESAHIGLNLLAANKDTVKELNQAAKPVPQRVMVEVVDASIPDAEAQ